MHALKGVMRWVAVAWLLMEAGDRLLRYRQQHQAWQYCLAIIEQYPPQRPNSEGEPTPSSVETICNEHLEDRLGYTPSAPPFTF